jgi:hypothetical protein
MNASPDDSQMKACSDCPFMRSSPLVGATDWLEDVIKRNHMDQYFEHSCHKTDPNADGYIGGKKRECKGHLQIIMNKSDKTPGKGGVYNSINELAETYFKHWLSFASPNPTALEKK